jgi:hypothetical protein
MARGTAVEIPPDLRARLEAARLDLLSLFRALDRLNLSPAEIPQRLIRQLFELDADYVEALWVAMLKRDHVSQRLLGDFGFSDVGRSFDGLYYTYSTPSDNFTFIAATPTRGVFQVDGWGWNRIAFGYAAYTHEWGKGRHAADTRFFALEYDDFRHILKTDNRPTAVRKGDTENIRINTFGGHSLHAFTTGAGTLDLLAWGAVQTGRWGTQQQLSYAFDLEGGWQPKILPRVKPWLRGGFTDGSGDGNPNDNKHETFFRAGARSVRALRFANTSQGGYDNAFYDDYAQSDIRGCRHFGPGSGTHF